MPKQLYKELFEEHYVHVYEGITFPELIMEGPEYKARFITFINVHFIGNFFLDNTYISIGICFKGCVFEESVIFNNVSANRYDGSLNPNSVNLSFENCTFKNIVHLRGEKSKIERAIRFKNSIFKSDLLIESLEIDMEGILIEGCTLEKDLSLSKLKIEQGITISENIFNSFVRIDSVLSGSFSIVGNNIFHKNIFFKGGYFINGLVFNNGLFNEEVYINQVQTKSNGLGVIGSEFKKSVIVMFHERDFKPSIGINEFYFSDANFKNGIYIKGAEELFSDLPIIEKIQLIITAELKGDIEFNNIHLGILDMSGTSNSANISFHHIFVNQIRVNNFRNNAGLVFTFIKPSFIKWHSDSDGKVTRENAVYIDDTNFGKAQFFQTDFSTFPKVVFHNNILTDISTSLVKWFTPDQLDGERVKSSLKFYKEAKKSKDPRRIKSNLMSLIATYSSKQEIYRQLKFASQRQGDMPSALEFQRHEMNYYRKIIEIRKPRRYSEWLILWSNQSNDFGQSWLKALGFFIVFSFIGFLPIGFLNSVKLDYSRFANSWDDIVLNLRVIFIDNIHNWLITLNPVHRLQDLNEHIDNLSKWIYLWDLLSRIIVSYFIFQMISAFRKFNK